MSSIVRLVVLGAAAIAVTTGCSNMTTQERNTAVGAAVGGAAGSVLTNGSTGGTLGGAAVGGVIGHEMKR